MKKKNFTLTNQQNGELAFKIFSFDDNGPFDHVQRHHYYSIIMILAGGAELQVDFATHVLPENSIICLSPYQPYMIRPAESEEKGQNKISGMVLNFHPDFFCTHRHQNEIETEGVLFHNIYEPPFFSCDDPSTLLGLIDQMCIEIGKSAPAQHELLVSYLKIFLITTLRFKIGQHTKKNEESKLAHQPSILQQLRHQIERHYKVKHSAGDYAEMLNITANALSKIVKHHFDTTMTELIAHRIMVEAKRELYLTGKSVKEIAYALGYDDEYYFSRFFKKQAGISPKIYRNTVGFDKLSTL